MHLKCLGTRHLKHTLKDEEQTSLQALQARDVDLRLDDLFHCQPVRVVKIVSQYWNQINAQQKSLVQLDGIKSNFLLFEESTANQIFVDQLREKN